jgi:hypothetical protein
MKSKRNRKTFESGIEKLTHDFGSSRSFVGKHEVGVQVKSLGRKGTSFSNTLANRAELSSSMILNKTSGSAVSESNVH